MRFRTLIPTIALLLLESHDVRAINGWPFYSSGEMDPCPRYDLINATSFNASYTYSNDTLAFELSGVHTTPGNASIGVAVVAGDGKEYRVSLDPCALGVPELCPASEGVVDISYTRSIIPSALASYLDLAYRTDVKFRLGLNIYGADQRLHSTCVETVLRSGGSDGENENPGLGGDGSSNTTVGNGEDDSTRPDGNGSNNATVNNSGSDSAETSSNGDANSPDDTTQDSGAGTLQAAWYLSMCVIAIWLL